MKSWKRYNITHPQKRNTKRQAKKKKPCPRSNYSREKICLAPLASSVQQLDPVRESPYFFPPQAFAAFHPSQKYLAVTLLHDSFPAARLPRKSTNISQHIRRGFMVFFPGRSEGRRRCWRRRLSRRSKYFPFPFPDRSWTLFTTNFNFFLHWQCYPPLSSCITIQYRREFDNVTA